MHVIARASTVTSRNTKILITVIVCCNVYRPLIYQSSNERYTLQRSIRPNIPRYRLTLESVSPLKRFVCECTARPIYLVSGLTAYPSTQNALQTHPVYLTIIFRPSTRSTPITFTYNNSNNNNWNRGRSYRDEKKSQTRRSERRRRSTTGPNIVENIRGVCVRTIGRNRRKIKINF